MIAGISGCFDSGQSGLGFEGWRRPDLIRWGVLYEKLSQAKQDMLDLANHTGKYETVPRFRAYKKTPANSFSDPTVALPYQGFVVEPDAQHLRIARLSFAQGFVGWLYWMAILNMYTGTSAFNSECPAGANNLGAEYFPGIRKK